MKVMLPSSMVTSHREDTREFVQRIRKDTSPGKGMVKLSLTVGEATMEVGFLETDSFAADVILGTAFIDSHVRKISSKGRRVTMTQGETAGIVDSIPTKRDGHATAKIRNHHVNKAKSSSSSVKHSWVFRQVTLKSRTKSIVLVRSDDSGIVVFGLHGSLFT